MQIKKVSSKDELLQVIFLRRKVLVEEFGYSIYKNEPDFYDMTADIFIANYGQKVVGTVRVREDGDVHRLQRVALDVQFRKRGIGTALLNHIKSEYAKLYVMSPVENVEFYGRFGFHKTGELKQGKKHKYFRMQNY